MKTSSLSGKRQPFFTNSQYNFFNFKLSNFSGICILLKIGFSAAVKLSMNLVKCSSFHILNSLSFKSVCAKSPLEVNFIKSSFNSTNVLSLSGIKSRISITSANKSLVGR